MNFPLVIGLGSAHGDDQAGWLVIAQLLELGFPSSHLRCLQHPADLLFEAEFLDRWLICDASKSEGRFGTINRFDWPNDKLLYQRSYGSHDLRFQDVLELGEAIGTMPRKIEIWTIDGADWQPCSSPSISIVNAAAQVAARIWEDCRNA